MFGFNDVYRFLKTCHTSEPVNPHLRYNASGLVYYLHYTTFSLKMQGTTDRRQKETSLFCVLFFCTNKQIVLPLIFNEKNQMALWRVLDYTGVTKYNLGKDSVDLLYVGNSYSLNLAMDNIFHSVGSNFNDFTVTVSGVGSVTCGSYSQSGRGAGWSSHSNIVDFNKIAKEFVTCSTSGNTLSINVTKSLYDYYESKETKIVEGNGETTTYTNKLYSINTDSDGNKPYFLVTVKHKTLGFSAQYKFFIGEEVSKVTPSKTTITF